MTEGFQDVTPKDLANALSRPEPKDSDFDLGIDEWAIENLSEEDLVLRFENTARASRAFTWMSVLAFRDDVFGYSIEVYLYGRSPLDLTFDEQQAMIDTERYSSDLSLYREEAQKIPPLFHYIDERYITLGDLQDKLQTTDDQYLLCSIDMSSEGEVRERESQELREVFRTY